MSAITPCPSTLFTSTSQKKKHKFTTNMTFLENKMSWMIFHPSKLLTYLLYRFLEPPENQLAETTNIPKKGGMFFFSTHVKFQGSNSNITSFPQVRGEHLENIKTLKTFYLIKFTHRYRTKQIRSTFSRPAARHRTRGSSPSISQPQFGVCEFRVFSCVLGSKVAILGMVIPPLIGILIMGLLG